MAGRRKKQYDKSVYRSLTMIMQFGVNMLVPICMMSALGIYLDQRFHTSFWMILLFLAGAVAGGQNVYRMAKRIYASPIDDKAGSGEKEAKEPEKRNENSR